VGLRDRAGDDIIVMEEHAKFALPEINVGVLADAGTIKLRRRIPYHVAVEFLMTALDGRREANTGPGQPCRPQGQCLAKAREIAQQLADGPPLLFRPSSSCCATPKWWRARGLRIARQLDAVQKSSAPRI